MKWSARSCSLSLSSETNDEIKERTALRSGSVNATGDPPGNAAANQCVLSAGCRHHPNHGRHNDESRSFVAASLLFQVIILVRASHAGVHWPFAPLTSHAGVRHLSFPRFIHRVSSCRVFIIVHYSTARSLAFGHRRRRFTLVTIQRNRAIIIF